MKEVAGFVYHNPIFANYSDRHAAPALPRIRQLNASKKNGAEDGTRTRYLQLGKLSLYQVSYFRLNTKSK